MNKGCLYSLIGIVALASIFLGYYLWRKSSKPSDEITHYKAEVKTIFKKTVTSGSIEPDREVLIKPQISGIIEELYIEAGDMIKRGDRIAKIKMIPSPTNLNAARSAVQLARLNLKEAQRQLKLQSQLNTSELDIASAKNQLDLAKKEEIRSSKLKEGGIISIQEYQRVENQLKEAQAAYDNAKLSTSGTVTQVETQVSLRREELNQAVNNLDLLEKGVASNSGQVSNIIISTINGMVLEVPIEEGFSVVERNNFNDGTTVAAIADMTALNFIGKVDETDVGMLKIGMPIKITIGAIPEKAFDSKLEYISPKGNPEEGAIKFEIRSPLKLPDDQFIRAGYSASGDIILNEAKDAISIKERDIIFDDDEAFVEIYKGGRNYDTVAIETGISDGIDIVIIQGIDTSALIKAQEKIVKPEKSTE